MSSRTRIRDFINRPLDTPHAGGWLWYLAFWLAFWVLFIAADIWWLAAH